MAKPRGARLAGFVMAILGIPTYGTTCPFGLLLSAEKFWEPERPRSLRICDWIGLIFSVPGCLFLPFFLVEMWHYSLIGPNPVILYLAFLTGWVWHRVRVVWNWPSKPVVSASDPTLNRD